MHIVRFADAPHVQKPEGTSVRYYLFKDYEVHYNEQAPKTTQTWHHHDVIGETLYIIDGQLTAKWRENGVEHVEVISAGDLVETERSPHTFVNDSDNVVRFLVLKRIPSVEDYTEIFKIDKIVDQ